MKETIENIVKDLTDSKFVVEEVGENKYKITITENVWGEDVSYSETISTDPNNLKSNVSDALRNIAVQYIYKFLLKKNILEKNFMKETIENIVKEYTDSKVIVEVVDEKRYRLTLTLEIEGKEVSHSHIISTESGNLRWVVLDALRRLSMRCAYKAVLKKNGAR